MVTVVVPAIETLAARELAVPLALYAQKVGIPECSFWGVHRASDPDAACRTDPWKKPERDMVARELLRAQEMIERVVNFSLVPEWVSAERRPYRCPVTTKVKRVIEAGIRATAEISLGEAVNHGADPAVVGPVAPVAAAVDEIRVYHPGTDVLITPSSVAVVAGALTIHIPRCRMLTEAAQQLANVPDYTVVVPDFEATVDIRRVYNDPSTNAKFIWPASSCTCGASCQTVTQDGCLLILEARTGVLRATPATYAVGWTATAFCRCGAPSYVDLYYRAGLAAITDEAIDAVIRLAHSLMPYPPCGCTILNSVWERDTNIPDVLSAERLNCPWGISDGAWVAWRFANSFAYKKVVML